MLESSFSGPNNVVVNLPSLYSRHPSKKRFGALCERGNSLLSVIKYSMCKTAYILGHDQYYISIILIVCQPFTFSLRTVRL